MPFLIHTVSFKAKHATQALPFQFSQVATSPALPKWCLTTYPIGPQGVTPLFFFFNQNYREGFRLNHTDGLGHFL